ncbi:MAG: CGNR zinc finger domain-containing protein [Solirubrobacteraceae bacterium]
MPGTVPANRFNCNNAVMDLPGDLELPLRSGASWWYWLGGRPALDFVNTRRERWWRDVETLVTLEDLGLWLVQAGLIEGPVEVDPALLPAALTLREAIDAAVSATLDGNAPDAKTVATIDAWLAEAACPDRLVVSSTGALELRSGVVKDLTRHALGLIARDAAEMLGTGQRDRLRVCASETCSARFFDRSRGGGRRWCSMQACGNVAKARRHRTRSADRGA